MGMEKEMEKFYAGWHHLNELPLFPRSMFSINRVIGRKSKFRWGEEAMLDSGAFTRLTQMKVGHLPVRTYALYVDVISTYGNLVAALSQDYMCEPFALQACLGAGFTDGTIKDHQRRTVENYLELKRWIQTTTHIMPVIQGYDPEEYAEHTAMYGESLEKNMWVAVGSVCKRNSHPDNVALVLKAIHAVRPDLRLHGCGIKKTALQHPEVQADLWSSDSMAASFAGRMSGQPGAANDPYRALAYAQEVEAIINA